MQRRLGDSPSPAAQPRLAACYGSLVRSDRRPPSPDRGGCKTPPPEAAVAGAAALTVAVDAERAAPPPKLGVATVWVGQPPPWQTMRPWSVGATGDFAVT